ncbi:hypothetical protein LUZ61_013009 [Rhynchospora tenuis]|uniref:TF-B3 domain-containing protein n=1 Tax=Rhynchospora tenuis TaxID=198213 RepID=A0AAD6A469_9POAL|nr:hypothetical protein LUZ61_013009 [Rhynchospora tenuis]
MIRSNGTFVLQSGWKEFVIANEIDKNDILVFSYNGGSSFQVAIFEQNGCEKAAAFFAKKREIRSDLESIDCEVKEEIMSSGSDSDSPNKISSRAARVLGPGERACCKRKRRDLQESTEIDEKMQRSIRKTKEKKSGFYMVPQKTFLTKAQEEIANRLARKTQKGSYLFVKILSMFNTNAHRNCSLNLPNGFACQIFQSKKLKVTLLPPNLDKSKGSTADYHKNKTGRRIAQGWRKFVCKNGLKEGDLCLFELRKQQNGGVLTMVVHFHFE